MTAEIICVECPNGCRLTVDVDSLKAGGDKVSGNKCPRGIAFAKAEVLRPSRTLTSTVRTVFPEAPVLPVRTSAAVPLYKLTEVMREINGITVKERLGRGITLAGDVAGTGTDLIITSDRLLR
jgi:CxxC motif-containing protein